MSTEGTNHDAIFLYNGPLSARMACHMGDYKTPALCNILGDQPLFYIDYVDQEEADFLDPMSLDDTGIPAEFYADDIDELRRRMARLERAAQHIDAYAREDIETAFDAACMAIARPQAQRLTREDVLAAISTSRMVECMYNEAAAKGLALVINPHVDTASYDRDGMCLHVNPRLTAELCILPVTRALRQAWMHMKGTAINPLHFAPEEAILLNRIQQADLAVAGVRAAWERNLAGDKAAWARIVTGSAYDMATGFAREAIADFRALNSGHAGHAAFERWFFSGRCKDVDRKLIQQMLADNHGLVFEHPQVSKMVTTDIIARTGDMPVGKNYLSGLIEMILADPLFTEVRDRSNANFLWFIKFERSFRAAEEGLETALEPASQIAAEDMPAYAHTSEVVAFTGTTRKKGKGGSGKQAADMATVYYIDHFLSLSNR